MASKQNKRRSSTFAQRTNAHLKAIERQINPQPKFGSIEGDPPAITNQGKFIDRIVIIAPVPEVLTIGDICKALRSSGLTSSGPSGDFYIRTVKIWGSPLAGNTCNVAAKFHISALLNAGTTTNTDTVVVQDFGTSSRRPGVRCSIPLPAAVLQNFDTTSEKIVADLRDANVIHVSVRQKL